MSTPIEQIKDKLDIVEFIRSYIPVHPAGKNFKALCPFHKEKTPSFMISPDRQTWHCFGACSEGGDIFKFLMKHDNLEFYEALKVLSEKAGIELKKISPTDQKQFGILYDINKSAKSFFRKELKQSKEAIKYLVDRGLKKETINEFEIGFAPNKYEALYLYLINLKYSASDIERSGFIFKNDRGNYTDRFRGRIMFPINNNFGKTVGFSGRILTEAQINADATQINADSPRESAFAPAKYINSPETPIFNKSKIIYGFDKSKNHIREQNNALLVEGQMDFLMCYQDGVKNVIAISGTALTPEQLKTLQRLTDQLIINFDNDEAGLKAAERSIDLAGAVDLNVKILILKDYKDPAEAVIKQQGLMIKLIKEAKPAMEFYFDRYIPNYQNLTSIDEKKRGVRVVLEKIKKLASSIEKHHWLKELSLKTEIEEKTLAEEMTQMRTNTDYSRTNTEDNQYKSAISPHESVLSRIDLIAQRLITLAAEKKKFQQEIKKYFEYLPKDYQIVYETIINKTPITEERLSKLINLISTRLGLESQNEEIDKEFKELLTQLKSESIKEKKKIVAKLIKEAEASGDEKKLKQVLKEFDETLKKENN